MKAMEAVTRTAINAIYFGEATILNMKLFFINSLLIQTPRFIQESRLRIQRTMSIFSIWKSI